MLRTASHPLFLIPFALLCALVAVCSVMEYDLDQKQDQIIVLLNDTLSDHVHRLDEALWRFQRDINDLDGLQSMGGWDDVPRAHLIEANQSLSKIETYFDQHPDEIISHKTQFHHFLSLREDMRNLDKLLSTANQANTIDVRELRKLSSKLNDDAQTVNQEIETVRHTRLTHAIDGIQDNEFWRETCLVLAFGMLILLTGFSLKMVQRYRAESIRSVLGERRYALFAAIVQSMKVGVAIRDMQAPDNPVIFVNRAFSDITGYELEDVQSKAMGFLMGLHTDSVDLTRLREAYAQNQPAAANLLLYKKDNTPFWGEWHMGPVAQSDNRVSHFYSIITDVSAMRATQESLQLAKESAEKAGAVKSNFLASMSHEIRTPINGVIGVLDLLADTQLDIEQARLVTVAQNSGRHLLEVVNDVLDYSKIEAGKLELDFTPFSLRQTVQNVIDIVKPVADSKGLSLSISITEDTPDKLLSDGGRIRQILLNLLANAVKFTEQGSVLLKIFKLMDQPDHTFNASLLRFEIIDTGIGISVADQERLFNEFTQVDRSFTRRFGGTGLGLAITKQLVKLLNGEVGVESHIGKGSRFWFMLPMQQTERKPTHTAQPVITSLMPIANDVEATAARKSTAPAQRQNGLTILLAEDNAVNQLVALRYLHKAGFQSDLAINGLEAVAKVQEKDFDAILMDVSMPEMDGLMATRKIRELGGIYTSIPIIAVTAHVMRGDREQCIAAGMNDYLCKPLHFSSLCNVLARWLPTYKYDENQENLSCPMPDAPNEAVHYDATVLANLARDLDKTITLNITKVFLEDSAKRIAHLIDEAKVMNFREIARESHALKSSSAGCGLLRLSCAMEKLELASNKEDADRIQSISATISDLYAIGRKELETDRTRYE